MKKQILLRSALGFPLGVCISNGILLIFAVCFGEYFPCAPDCAARFGSEVAGAAEKVFLSGLVGAVFAGNMNALIFSLLGGVTAMGVMIALSRLKRLSVYGVSVGGAAAHNCGQVAAAVLTLGNTAPLYYLPVLLGVSLFTGALTGLIAACLFRALAHTRLWGV